MARTAKRSPARVSKFSPMSGHAFLDEHRATLVPDGSGLALRYPVASYEYGSRLEESVDCEIPIGARDYDVAL
jgi:hypothetical protein